MLENFVMDDQIQINVEAELLTPFQGGPSIMMEMKRLESKVTSLFTEKVRQGMNAGFSKKNGIYS